VRFVFVIFLGLFIHLSIASTACANDAKSFLNLLEKHYQSTSSIQAFSLTHSYLGRSEPYQSWDFKAPSRYKAFKVTDIDMNNQHYYQNVVHHYTGGLYFDEVHFQNNEESLRYERNGISLGKSVLKQNMNSFSRYKNLTLMNLDFFAVRPLLNEKDMDSKIELQQHEQSGMIILIHHLAEQKTMEYVFNTKPLRLVSINNTARKRIYLYDDYRQSNGFNFAHSLIKKYNGDSIPSFITRIEKFEVIDGINQGKLTLPMGYYHGATGQSKDIVNTSIAPNLYLATDATAINNVLFKITDNNITVFGVPRSSKLSEQLIETIKQDFPDKHITGVFVTHPYSDHISGLLPFIELGAKIYADAYTIKAITAYPHFAHAIDKFAFETITHGQVIDDVRYYVLENARSKRQSFAYFEQSGIIFQSDFLEVALDNTIAKILPSYSKQFIEFVRGEQLNINRIVGFHRNNNISPALMKKLYQTNTM